MKLESWCSLTGGRIVRSSIGRSRSFRLEETLIPTRPAGRPQNNSTIRLSQVQCSACHDNKNAYVINPHIATARVGYGEAGERAASFSLGDYLPEMPRREDAPFRIIGSDYTLRYSVEIARARTVRDPTGNCTGCHTLTTQLTGQRFAADAVALEPWIPKPTWIQSVGLKYERHMLAEVDAHRTDWARQSGAGKIHPWMAPRSG